MIVQRSTRVGRAGRGCADRWGACTTTSPTDRVRLACAWNWEHEADALLGLRFAVVNVWRSIRGPVLDAPLAVCDARTVAQEDFVSSDLIYRERTGEVYQVKHNAGHRWFYVSALREDEALLLKCYDSATDGRARFAPHTAFEDPATPPDAPPRESIELRAFVFYPN